MTSKPSDALNNMDALTEKVVDAFYAQVVKQARDQVAEVEFAIEKITSVFEVAVTASDREAAILIFCLVDDIATDFFRSRLTGNVHSGVDETFLKGNGMLASAYNKIALLAGLEWIRNETYRNLTLLRKIRNEFAHYVKYKSFEDDPISNYINSMIPIEKPIINVIDEEKGPMQKNMPIRSKFLVRSALTVLDLTSETVIIQAAIEHGVDPASIAKEKPENLKTLGRAIMRIVLDIVVTPTSN